MKCRHIDLFSGIGGFALAARWVWGAEHEIVTFCEREEFPRKVLKKHWPDVPCINDIHDLRGDDYGAIDLVTGGFPCQPFSVAGKQRGAEDDRYLWPETLRVLSESNAAWFIGENVAGLVSMGITQRIFKVAMQAISRGKVYDFFKAIYTRQETMLLESICQDLEKIGYEVAPLIIPACAVNAPHRRDRVWIVANSKKLYSDGSDDNPGISMEGRKVSQPRNCSRAADVAHATSEGFQDGGRSQMARSREAQPESKRRSCFSGRVQNVGHSECSGRHREPRRRAGAQFEDGCQWAVEPAVGRVAHGVPRRVDRLRRLGNAIVPQVAAVIMSAINEVDKETP